MKNQQWQLKYADLKLKFHDAVDVAFRLGFEQGAQQAQVQQAQQAEQAAQQAEMAAMGQQPGQPGQDPNAIPSQEMSDGSELDQHIGELEGMLGSSKPGSPEQAGLQKSLNSIKALKKSLKDSHDLRKSERAIAAIGKALNPSFNIGKAATKNLSAPAAKALSMQEHIVNDVMKGFAEEEARAAESITKTLSIEQLIKV